MRRLRRIFGCLGCLVLLLSSVSTPAAAQPFAPGLLSHLHWRLIGPFRGGRTVAAVGVPGEPHLFYIGANNGGVWKTTDAGRTWAPIFDGQPTQSIGAIAVAPSDSKILYVGSGEGLQRPDLSVGDGIYKSTDAGQTWQHLGLAGGQQIPALLVDPKNPDRVFAAVLGHPYGPNPERGVFRSTDGGKSWEKVLYKDENTGAVDLAFDPANPQTVYAVLWAARQAPWEIGGSFNAPGSGLFKSTDGGTTWKPIGEGLPSIAEGLGRIGIAISPRLPSRMYAQVEADAKHGGTYRSDDAGATWRRVNDEERIWGRGGDFAEIKVDPRNPEEVYVCNTSTYRSTDGGQSWTAIKGAPGGDDYHRIWINPNDSNILLLGSDQGATVSLNGGRTWSSWYNQPTAQFYHVITDNRFPYWVYGGQQESGSAGVASRGDDGQITFRDWHPVGAEEYGYVAPDPLHPNLIYGGKISRFDWTTGQVQDISPEPVRAGKFRYVRTLPVLFSPVDPHVLDFGANVLFITTDGGNRWQTISPDLTREKYEVPASLGIFSALDPDRGTHRGVIYTIGPSFKSVNLIWAGTDDGLIHLTRDGGKHWRNVTPKALTPWSKVSLLEASHFDLGTAYAAINRFRLDDLAPHIFRTRDFGATWQEITHDIPEGEVVNAVREDPVRRGLLYAGTEKGVYVSWNDGADWQSLRGNLPATAVRDLVVHGDDLVVGTHGRGFWILDDIASLRQLEAQVTAADAHLFRPAVAYRLRRDLNTDTPLPPEEPAGQNPPDGAVLDYYLRTGPGEDAADPTDTDPGDSPGTPVTLEILDAKGQLVRRYASDDRPEPVDPKELAVPFYWVRQPRALSARPGMHRFVWDLRYPTPPVLERDYPISAIYRDTPREPLGPFALPGTYQVRLTAGGKTSTQPLTVKMDPRVKTPHEVLAGQLTLARQMVAAIERDAAALKKAQALRTQLQALPASAREGALGGSVQALDGRLAALIDAGERSKDSLTQMNGALARVYETVEGADQPPTTQVRKAAADLERRLAVLLGQWNEAATAGVAGLDEQLRKAGLPALKVER
ncbi:MAG: hypothetical protein QOJ16_1384 [Acidobacteriota bacterium]|nr:hypothetical protein [Acidobacteriota bacterium]